MTEEETKQPQSSQPDGIERDLFVQTLADVANRTGLGVGLTLHTHGMLVSGNLISNVRFFELVREGFEEAVAHGTDEEGATAARDFLVNIANDFTQAMRDRNQETLPDNEPELDVRYIHMQDVALVVPGQHVLRLKIWRGRISEITGFSVGNVNFD